MMIDKVHNSNQTFHTFPPKAPPSLLTDMLMVLSLIPRVVAMVLCTESMYWVEQVTSSPPSSLGLETIRRTITMM